MRFINREKELRYLDETRNLSRKKLFTIVIFGQRRIGKTRLLIEFLTSKDLYFFVNKRKSSLTLLKEFEEILKNKGIMTKLETLSTWDDFVHIIFDRVKGSVAFDEFQNFIEVEPSIFGIFQKFIDLNENREDLLLIFTGSTIGLIQKIFRNKKEPLYGRIKRRLKLTELDFKAVTNMCRELKIEDIEEITKIYLIFGGFPKYYVSIEDENLMGANADEIIDRFFLRENAILEDEVMDILSLEFGKKSGVYYDILTAIANGNTSLSQIASFLNRKATSISRHLYELLNFFEIISVEERLFRRRRRFYIRHPLMNFWFRFFHKNLSAYQIREEWLTEYIKKNLNSYFGEVFERRVPEIFGRNIVPFRPQKIGRYWGKIPTKQKGRNEFEIDLIAYNEITKNIAFFEVKWKDFDNKKDITRILRELRSKSRFVEWYNRERIEYYGIIAKKIKEEIKESLRYEGYLVWDLEDVKKKVFRKSSAG